MNHDTLTRTGRQLVDEDWADLLRRLHHHLEVERRWPSTPDGHPTTTSGSDSSRGGGDNDSVLAAVLARATHRDEHAALTYGACAALRAIDGQLTVLRSHLARLDALRATQAPIRANDERGCWAMERIGVWEPVHTTRRIGDELRPLGRWAADFHTRTGRAPTLDECRKRRDGVRVMVKAS